MSKKVADLLLSMRPVAVSWDPLPMAGAVPEKVGRHTRWVRGVLTVDGPFIKGVDAAGFVTLFRADRVKEILNGRTLAWVKSGSIGEDELSKLVERYDWDEGPANDSKPLKLHKECDVGLSMSDDTFDYQAVYGASMILRVPHNGQPSFVLSDTAGGYFSDTGALGSVEVARGLFAHFPAREVTSRQEGRAVVWSSPDAGETHAPLVSGEWGVSRAHMKLLREAIQAVTSKRRPLATITRSPRMDGPGWLTVRGVGPQGPDHDGLAVVVNECKPSGQ